MRIVVLPSPFLGPTAYGPLADALGAQVAELPPQPFDAAAVLAAFTEATRDADLLVPHSNAGLYAAALGLPCVFMDAALPPVDGGHTPLAPPALAAGVAGLADATGLLPPWTRWWPREAMREVLPDAWFDAVDATAPRVPVDYLTDALTTPTDWASGPRAYLAFGDTYAQQLALATDLGWPSAQMPGGHLKHLLDPVGVAATVRSLGSGHMFVTSSGRGR